MSVRVEIMTIPGAPVAGTNPLPRFRRESGFRIPSTRGDFPASVARDLGNITLTLPYRIQDRYGRQRIPLSLKTIVLENEYLRAVFVPEYGGRLWSLFDKVQGRELLMSNPVLQPGNLAIRNAWLSGGIEWNFGSRGHTYFTCDNVWTAVLKDGKGEEFVRIYEFERAKECVWQADFHLPEGSRQLFSHIRVHNPGADSTTYWWTNIAIPEDGKTRILSSSEHVMVVVGAEAVTYEKLPYLSVMPGDLSYPSNATRSFDYFFQPDEGVRTTWEGGVNREGCTFYDRSTAPLVYHKMFCWGNHRAGARWQEFLSDGDRGRYIEIQSGFARSQLHDKPFLAGQTLEWTQCYGGTKLDPADVHGCELHEANLCLGQRVEELIPEQQLLAMDREYRADADLPVDPGSIVHSASGWGALENLHRELSGEAPLPASLCFPPASIGAEQYPWYHLLTAGRLPEADPGETPVSWMTSPRWMELLEKSLSLPGGRTWYSLLHYGNMLFEMWDNAHVAAEAMLWPDRDRYEALAESAWRESVSLTRNVWALRNLAVLEHIRKDRARTEACYDEAFLLAPARKDFAFAAEYMGWLNEWGEYEKAWTLFESLPEDIRSSDRVTLRAALTSVRLGKLEYAEHVFNREYADLREGETSLTDLWFEFQTRKLALQRGLEVPSPEQLEELKAEAEDRFPPPHAIDFRMSYDKKQKYRDTQ